MELDAYRSKRNFTRTREPRGRVTRKKTEELSFVVHKHAARRLHYDLRLELNGVLASWAVPKGPSLNPTERRLAVQVEDHPLQYGNFEGTIPEGEYGAGAVIVWDRGTWQPDGDPVASRRRGKLKFSLHGEKLTGGWSLVRMTARDRGPAKNWLLIKERDESAQRRDITRERPESVQTGRVVETVGEKRPAKQRPRKSRISGRPNGAKSVKAGSKLPRFVRPQLTTLVDTVPAGDDWLHEIKFDGYRLVCRIDAGRISFLTREGQDWTKRFTPLTDAIAQRLSGHNALLDGEVVALKDDGKTDFQLLQNSLKNNETTHLVYFVFDLLHLDGVNVTALPLRKRKQELEKLLGASASEDSIGALRYSQHWIGQGQELFEECCRKGMEGIISKRVDLPYRPGRSRDWLKIKCSKSQELVIGGFTDPAGSRRGLGALLVGVRDDNGQLRYSGRVGTGFTQQSLTELRSRLNRLVRPDSPFSNLSRKAKGVHWVAPELVAMVSFSEWTRDQLLRHPSFQGLREDKPARTITREKVLSTEETIKTKKSEGDNGIEIAGVKLTHPNRILYREKNISKADLANYYAQVSEWILPHIEARPLTVVRCPEGTRKQCFYQRHGGASLRRPIGKISVKEKGKKVSYVAVDSLPGLIALVQMGVLEIHTWGSRQEQLERPDRVTFDLDPDPKLPWEQIKEAALTLRSRLARFDLAAFVKTTGGKGLHIVVPLKPKQGWEEVKQFARNFAEALAAEAPELYTTQASKARRKGKIFLDYLRNGRTATAVAAYSSRAHENAPVSVPLRWRELSADLRGAHFNVENVPKRLAKLKQDPWAGYEQARRQLSDRLIREIKQQSERS